MSAASPIEHERDDTEVDSAASTHDRARFMLAQVGSRYTRARRQIVATLDWSDVPLTVAELCTRSGLPLSSAYRNVRFLTSATVLERAWSADKAERFELAGWVKGSGHHHHLLCTACGLQLDYDAPDALEQMIAAMLPPLAGSAGFTIRQHTLDLIGLCQDCTTPPR